MITRKKKREELQLLRDEALDAYMNREEFQYDLNADALYRHYKNQYTELGKTAMQDTMGQAAALTGGYGSSYAQNVGQQAYNRHMQQLGDVIPELYQLAYDRYQDKGDQLYRTYQSWAQLEQQAAEQEQRDREFELAEQRRRDENARFQLEQERKKSQIQTVTFQPDYGAMLTDPESKKTVVEPEYDNGNVSEGNIKTMQRLLGLQDTGKWTDLEQQKAGNLKADAAWQAYQQGKLQGRSRSGMSMEEWAAYKSKQSKSSDVSNTKENTPAVQNFISGMVTEDQAAERGVNSTEWKMMVVDRLNRMNMTMDEFEQLEKYYGLDIPGGSSAMPQGNTANNAAQKLSYAEYREKTAAPKVSDLNTAVQQYFDAYQAFANSAIYDIQYTGYNNAAYMRDIRVRTAKELRKRADMLASALRMNTDIISGDCSELLTQIVSTKTGIDSIMDFYGGQVKYYSRWDSENAFNKAVERAEADKERWTELTGGYDPITNQEEGKAGWEAYVADKEQSAQRTAEAEAKKASEGYSWKQFWDDLGRWMGPGVNPDTSLPFHTDVQLIAQGYRDEEAAKRVPDERWTDELRYTYGYLWKDSRKKAGDYAFAVNNMLNTQQEQEQLQQIMEWSTANFGSGAAHTAAAIASAPFGLADFLGDVIQSGTLGYVPEADGKISPFEYSQAVTSGISQHLNTEYGTLNEKIPIIGGKGWGDVYGLGTSVVQSSVAAFSGGPGQALITFFGSAAAAGVDDAMSRGANGQQAVAYGSMVGLAEALAEMIGVDNLMKIGSSATVKQLVWNILKQGAAEGIEEGVTSVLNNFADNLIMGDKSNFNILVSEYMDQGLSEEKAKKKAWMNMAGDIAFDMLGGFVSGEVHAGPLTAMSYVKTQNQYAKTGSGIMDTDGGVDALLNSANEVRSVSSAQMQNALTKQIDKVNQKPIARNVGRLYQTVQQANASVNQADVTKRLESKGISSKTATGIAEAVVARLNGQELTRTQRNLLRSALDSPTVLNVISDVTKKKSDGIDSTQKRMYDEVSISDGLTNEEKAALWNLETQSVAVFSNHDYTTATEGSAPHPVQNAFSDGIYEGGAVPDFYVGPNGKALPSQYKDWIGTNIQKELLDQAENSQLQNAIKQLYRGNSFIGDGGTADVIRFEQQTGLMLGKNGGSHVQKGIDMAKYIENKILTQDLSLSERALATQLLEDLYNAIGR